MTKRDIRIIFNKHGTEILLGLAAVGTITTAVFSSMSAIKAVKLLEEAKEESNEPLTKKEVVLTVLPAYIPTIAVTSITLLCIFGANANSKRMQAAIASLYSMTDQSFKDYRNKVKELYGEEADNAVTDAIMDDISKEFEAELSRKGDDWNTLFYEPISDTYFYSDKMAVLRAEHELNRTLLLRGCICVNSFLGYLGLDPVESCEDLGWNGLYGPFSVYAGKWIDVTHKKRSYNGETCYELSYSHDPEYGYDMDIYSQ